MRLYPWLLSLTVLGHPCIASLESFPDVVKKPVPRVRSQSDIVTEEDMGQSLLARVSPEHHLPLGSSPALASRLERLERHVDALTSGVVMLTESRDALTRGVMRVMAENMRIQQRLDALEADLHTLADLSRRRVVAEKDRFTGAFFQKLFAHCHGVCITQDWGVTDGRLLRAPDQVELGILAASGAVQLLPFPYTGLAANVFGTAMKIGYYRYETMLRSIRQANLRSVLSAEDKITDICLALNHVYREVALKMDISVQKRFAEMLGQRVVSALSHHVILDDKELVKFVSGYVQHYPWPSGTLTIKGGQTLALEMVRTSCGWSTPEGGMFIPMVGRGEEGRLVEESKGRLSIMRDALVSLLAAPMEPEDFLRKKSVEKAVFGFVLPQRTDLFMVFRASQVPLVAIGDGLFAHPHDPRRQPFLVFVEPVPSSLSPSEELVAFGLDQDDTEDPKDHAASGGGRLLLTDGSVDG